MNLVTVHSTGEVLELQYIDKKKNLHYKYVHEGIKKGMEISFTPEQFERFLKAIDLSKHVKPAK